MKKIIILIITAFFIISSNAQQVWYFGQGAGIQFPVGSGLPTAYTSPLVAGNPIKTDEGCAIMYDAAGAILFSTDGSTVYDKTNNAMLNGTGLLGNSSSTQSAVIVPVPGCDCNKYFIFTVDDINHFTTEAKSYGLNYSVVDMNLNSGKGGITTVTKNSTLIHTTETGLFNGCSSEKLTACKDGNGGYWLIAHGARLGTINANQTRFYAFHITASSIGDCTSPTVSRTITDCVTTDIPNSALSSSGVVGQMKISPSGTRIAYTTYNINRSVELFNFNISTGVVSNQISIGTFGNSTYGLEFSPNEQYLYVSEIWNSNSNNLALYQLDITLPPSTIFSSKTNLHTVANKEFSYGSLQLWKDGRIYVANTDENAIGVVRNPDLAGLASNYVHKAIILPSTVDSKFSLPTFIQDFTNCADPCNKCHNVGFFLDKFYTMRKDNTIKIGCNQSLDFNPNNGCSTTDRVPVLGISVKDNANNTPAWANTFITNNGSGSFTPPSTVNTYTVTYYFGTTNPLNNKKDTCDKISIIIQDTCQVPPPQCTCGQWGSTAYSINGVANKFSCNAAPVELQANQGDLFKVTPQYLCTGWAATPPCNTIIKYDIYYPKGSKSLNVNSITDFKLDSCGIIRIVMKPTCGGIACPPCEFTINVNCCKCAKNPEPMLFYGTSVNGQFILKKESLKCGETYTNKLECFKQYDFLVSSPCGINCDAAETIITVLQPNGVTTLGSTLIANQVGTYTVTIKVKCNGIWCAPCVIKFVQTKNCEPPCNNCKDKVSFEFDSGASSVDVKTNPVGSTLNATFVLGGGTDTYTNVRANVVDFQITSDNPACLQCYDIPNQWGSIIGGNIAGFTNTITTYPGVSAANSFNSSREIVFNTATPATIPMGTNLNLAIKIPGVNPISCCCIKVVLYIKITYRNNKCEECTKIVRIGFTECPKANSDAVTGSGSGGTAIFDLDSGIPVFKMHAPNKEDAKTLNNTQTSNKN